MEPLVNKKALKEVALSFTTLKSTKNKTNSIKSWLPCKMSNNQALIGYGNQLLQNFKTFLNIENIENFTGVFNILWKPSLKRKFPWQKKLVSIKCSMETK